MRENQENRCNNSTFDYIACLIQDRHILDLDANYIRNTHFHLLSYPFKNRRQLLVHLPWEYSIGSIHSTDVMI